MNGRKPWRSGHLPINGLDLYFELHRGPRPATALPLLVILPATTHLGVAGRWAEVAPMVRHFLDDVAQQDPDLFAGAGNES